MRPYGVLTQLRENGRLHPDVKKLRFRVRLRYIKRTHGLDGLRLKKPAESCEPVLEVSRLVLRCAGELPFPKYDDRFFAEGVSGKPGDFSLKLTDGDAFCHPTGSQAVWGDNKQVRDPKELFFPIGDGTVEFFLKPEAWSYVAPKKYVVLVNTWNAHGIRAGRHVTPRQNLFELRYFPNEKKLGIMIKDARDKSVYRETPAEIPAGKWSHLAAQWSQNGGVQLFVDGKKVMDDKKWSCTPLDISKESHPNAIVPMQVTFGCLTTRARGDNRYSRQQYPDYKGLLDNIRTSSVVRYQNDFTKAIRAGSFSQTMIRLGFFRSTHMRVHRPVGPAPMMRTVSSSVISEIRAAQKPVASTSPTSRACSSENTRFPNFDTYANRSSVRDYNFVTVPYSVMPGTNARQEFVLGREVTP